MFRRIPSLLLGIILLDAIGPAKCVSAQEPAPARQVAPDAAGTFSGSEKILLPARTRLPLLLRNNINTRTARAADSVYFETVYPIAQDGRIVIPMGSFVRGRLVEVRRRGSVKGGCEIRFPLDSLTFPNGYTVALSATPNSTDSGEETVNHGGKIKGPSGDGKDVSTLALATVGGLYVGSSVGLVAGHSASSMGRGAAIGSAAGFAAGLAAVLLTRGPEAELPRGTTLDVILDQPLALDASHLPLNDPGRVSLAAEPVRRQQDKRQQDRTVSRPQPGSLLRLLHF